MLIPITIYFFIGGVPETILARDLTTIADDSFNTLLTPNNDFNLNNLVTPNNHTYYIHILKAGNQF